MLSKWFQYTLTLIVVTLICANCAYSPIEKVDENAWWKTANFYQIYPRSFRDWDNDGSGDLAGIINKLGYLSEIGVDNVWMSPIFESPMVDAGYDISDFTKINPLFGTMKDFENLLKEAHDLGMRIILDFVPNHSSDQHVWFYKSVHRVPGYEDYYIWHNGTEQIIDDIVIRHPPNNWLSVFMYSAWEWNDIRQQFYFHQFAKEQPDLNFRNPAVVVEMENILRFWLDKGVDGFRVDAIPHLFENETLEDEPTTGNGIPNVDWSSLNHTYTMDQDETFDMVYQFRAICDEYTDPPRVFMTEAYTSLENTMRYFGNETTVGASFSFNFILLTGLQNYSSAVDFENVINTWMNAIDPKYTSSWVVGNHDNHRTATRHGDGRVDGINMLVNILPGVGVTYNGEEIGMEDGFVSWEDTQDPNAINAGEDRYLEVTRDPERTPFHWDSSTNAGFNTGTKPWLPVSEKYVDTNVARQRDSAKSHLSIFKEIMNMRKEETIMNGNLLINALNEDILLVARTLVDGDSFILIFNVNDKESEINLKTALPSLNLPDELYVSIASIDSTHVKGNSISTNERLVISANEALIVGTNIVGEKNNSPSIYYNMSILLCTLTPFLITFL